MREVRRVLRKDGVFWLNIGDSWWAQRPHNAYGSGDGWLSREHMTRAGGRKIASLKPLDMVLIPQRLAIAAQENGWYVRSIIIWSKSNPMPESVNGRRWERHKIKVRNRGRAREAYSGHIGYQDHDPNGGFFQDAIWRDCPGCPKCNPNDGYILRKGSWRDCPGCPKCNPNDGYILHKGNWRPTDSFEYILMLTKSNSYYCDKEAVAEASIDPESYSGRRRRSYNLRDYEGEAMRNRQGPYITSTQGPYITSTSTQAGKKYPRRNMHSVWTFPVRSYSGAHFATYPPRLPELCIRASTSEAGCCLSCGAPYARMIDRGMPLDEWKKAMGADSSGGYHGKAKKDYSGAKAQDASELKSRILDSAVEKITSGWRPTCKCDAGPPVPCWILDPFSGAGTTALAAERLGRDSINIDTSEAYNELARQRLLEDKKKR